MIDLLPHLRDALTAYVVQMLRLIEYLLSALYAYSTNATKGSVLLATQQPTNTIITNVIPTDMTSTAPLQTSAHQSDSMDSGPMSVAGQSISSFDPTNGGQLQPSSSSAISEADHVPIPSAVVVVPACPSALPLAFPPSHQTYEHREQYYKQYELWKLQQLSVSRNYRNKRNNLFGNRTWMAPDGRIKIFLPYVENVANIPEDVRYWHDETHFIIKDRYPKSTVHLLVMPRVLCEKLFYLSDQHGIDMVRGLQSRGEWLINRLKAQYPHLSFTMGFHVIPSMLQIHLHVISTDFCAETMKNFWNFNAFTTPYFVSPQDVIKIIQERKQFLYSKLEIKLFKHYLKLPLKCNQCDFFPLYMGELKLHLQEHLYRRSSMEGATTPVSITTLYADER
ncbi:hypothetical protein EDD11_007096 [Mortierella claussenii]|nr:hypothetical protein EDD11_007096 [Mortierella claussenii]